MRTDFELRSNPPPGLMPLQGYSSAWKRFRGVTVARKNSNGQRQQRVTEYSVAMTNERAKPASQVVVISPTHTSRTERRATTTKRPNSALDQSAGRVANKKRRCSNMRHVQFHHCLYRRVSQQNLKALQALSHVCSTFHRYHLYSTVLSVLRHCEDGWDCMSSDMSLSSSLQ